VACADCRGSKRSAELALEIVACAGLLKGYGDTYRRGASNDRIIETRVIRPVPETRVGGRAGLDAVARGSVARSGG
jgi:indolepyruvate ferredoxin oxidoreductase, beta subunit